MSRSKQQQVLEIEPLHELRFKGPFVDVVTSHLKLRNPSDKRVCFKVKTTAPKRYCVRPNSGFVNAGEEVDVSVMLQPMDPDAHDKGKHKFMVQSMFAPAGVDDIEKMWAEAQPADLMDSKLKCVFEEVGDEDVPFRGSGLTPPPPSVYHGTLPSVPHAGELQSIMEECKRLQSENAKLKQLSDEYKEALHCHLARYAEIIYNPANLRKRASSRTLEEDQESSYEKCPFTPDLEEYSLQTGDDKSLATYEPEGYGESGDEQSEFSHYNKSRSVEMTPQHKKQLILLVLAVFVLGVFLGHILL